MPYVTHVCGNKYIHLFSNQMIDGDWQCVKPTKRLRSARSMTTAAVDTQHSAKREKLNQISSLASDCNFKTEFTTTNWVEEPLSLSIIMKSFRKQSFYVFRPNQSNSVKIL